jgi:hypothetical protein
MDTADIWVIGEREYVGIAMFREALRSFLEQHDAAERLEADVRAQQSVLAAFERHYHWDPASGVPPMATDVVRVVVERHPTWGSQCFALVLRDGQGPFRFSVKKLKSTHAPSRSGDRAPGASTPGQARRNLYEALRAGVREILNEWEAATPVPATCPVTGSPLGPRSQRTDPTLRSAPNTPTVDHYDPTMKVRIQSFLNAEGIGPDGVPLTKNAATGEWELSDDAMLERWRQFHGTGGLRWVSLEGNRLENLRSQRDE